MDKLASIKIKQKNSSYTSQIPIGVFAQNVQWDGTHSLLDILGSVDVNTGGKGNIQHQFDDIYQNINNFTDGVNTSVDEIENSFNEFTNNVNQNINDFTDNINTSVNNYTENLDNSFDNFKDNINQHLSDVLGNIDISETGKGTVQHQMDQLYNDMSSFHNQMTGQIGTNVTNWLNSHVTPVGSAITVDNSLTISNAAADAKTVGDFLSNNVFVMNNQITADTDLDIIVDNGAYLLFANYTYTNCPSFYASGAAWLFVINTPSKLHKVQYFIERNTGITAYRYYSVVSGIGAWRPWIEYNNEIEIDNELSDSSTNAIQNKVVTSKINEIDTSLGYALKSQENINTDIDLDDIIENGIYILFANNSYTNAPAFYTSGVAWIITITNQSSTQKIQYFIDKGSGNIAVRFYQTVQSGNNRWLDWIIYNTPMYNSLKGKKVSILGDSISTYSGYIPEGYNNFYPKTDVTDVNKTWWMQVINNGGMSLLRNASWAGSVVSYRNSYSPSLPDFWAYNDNRIKNLSPYDASGNVTTEPDIIIVFIGTNDFKYCSDLGTFTETTEVQNTNDPIYTFRNAYACMLKKIVTRFPNAHIYCCTLLQRASADDNDGEYPIINSHGIALSQFNSSIIEIATWMGLSVIRLDNVFTLSQARDKICTFDGLHPNYAGTKLIAKRILNTLQNNE